MYFQCNGDTQRVFADSLIQLSADDSDPYVKHRQQQRHQVEIGATGEIFTAAVDSVLLAAEQPAEANEGKPYLLQI